MQRGFHRFYGFLDGELDADTYTLLRRALDLAEAEGLRRPAHLADVAVRADGSVVDPEQVSDCED